MDDIYIAPFLRIKRDENFNKDLLPKIDALASEQGITRSDIIRDILYRKFDYEQMARSQKQINKDHIEERQRETELKYRCILVRVDHRYFEMFYTNMVEYPGNLDKNINAFFNQAMYEYFGLEVPEIYSMKFDKPIIRPEYQRLRITGLRDIASVVLN